MKLDTFEEQLTNQIRKYIRTVKADGTTALQSFDAQVATLETALNRRSGQFTVKLSNVGNPDYRQDCTRPLPETTCGWARIDSLKEAVQLCRLYISFYDLGGGNWNGGMITRTADGLVVGHVSYNGRVWEKSGRDWTPDTKELCVS